MTTPVTTPIPIVRNAGDSGSFFAAQQENPSGNVLITAQVDPTAPEIVGLKRISNPVQPTSNASVYVQSFDPDLYDLRDGSHLMRLIRAITGASGIGGIRKQSLISRLSSMLSDGSFLDLDKFYGAIFGLRRHEVEGFPTNLDGTTLNPYTDIANSDLWDDLVSRDARYRSRLFQLARAVNMGATYPGLKAAAEAVLNCDVDIAESWVKTDFLANNFGLLPTVALTFGAITSQYVTYGNTTVTYSALQGTQFGAGSLPAGNRGELIFTPNRTISLEEHWQLSAVLNTLKPAHVQVTLAAPIVESSTALIPRVLAADSENWSIQARVTPAISLVNPIIPVYNNTGPYSEARPAYSDYSGEQWSYAPNVTRAVSYQIIGDSQTNNSDDQIVTYDDNYTHTYYAADGVRDVRQAISFRLSGEGPVTTLPYPGERPSISSHGELA